MTSPIPRLSDWHPGLCQLTLGDRNVISIDEGPDDDVLEVTINLPVSPQDFSVWLVEDRPLPPIGEFTLVKVHRVGADHAPIVSALRALPALAKSEPDAPPKSLADFLVGSGLTFGQALALAPTPAPAPDRPGQVIRANLASLRGGVSIALGDSLRKFEDTTGMFVMYLNVQLIRNVDGTLNYVVPEIDVSPTLE